MIKEKFPKIRNEKLSKKTKKIITTAVITFLVFAFFIWLGVGMYVSVPTNSRGELWPMYIMYAVFPALIFWFGAKRVYDIVNGEDDDNDDETEDDEE
ncbi:MAG: hypothetical protein IJ306_02360 [Oscillospiraceae bacterium]|nr:hypothetical protein [Oscillospiraceae bacterium]